MQHPSLCLLPEFQQGRCVRALRQNRELFIAFVYLLFISEQSGSVGEGSDDGGKGV